MASIFFDGTSRDLGDVEDTGARVARALRNMGVGADAVIAIWLRNEPSFIEALTCIRCLNAARVLIPWPLTAGELGSLLMRARVTVLIADETLLAEASRAVAALDTLIVIRVTPRRETLAAFELRPSTTAPFSTWLSWDELSRSAPAALPIPAGSPAAISLSSGSTGVPQVIRRDGPQSWVRWITPAQSGRPEIRSSLVTAPLYFGGQYGVFSQAWRLRADIVLMPKFDAETFLAAVERHRVTHAYLVPTMFVRLLRMPESVRRRYDLSSLDYVVHTGATCPLDIKRQMIEWWGPIIWESYGTSEVPAISAASSTEWVSRPGTVGKPVKRVVILDETGDEIPVGQTGHIFAEVTAMAPVMRNGRAVSRRRVGSEDFAPTGDMGFLDGDGYLYVVGRADDLINTGRVKVYPLEIENAILQHPEVLDCAAFPMPDLEFGQVIAAVVQITSSTTIAVEHLRSFLTARLSEHKIPSRIWLQQIPLRSEAGKFNRGALARQFASVHSVI